MLTGVRALVGAVLVAVCSLAGSSAALAQTQSVTAVPFTATAGQQFQGEIGIWYDGCGPGIPPQSVSVNWGDGTSNVWTPSLPPSNPTLNVIPGTANCEIDGTHTYAQAGKYTTTVSVVVVGAGAYSDTSTATVTGATPPACDRTAPGASPPFKPNTSSPDARWIQAVYSDLLGRPIDQATLGQLSHAMLDGASRELIVAFLEGDPDRPIIVGSLYSAFLGREPSASELTSWTQALANGSTDEQVAASLLGSDEYFAGAGGGTNAGFVAAMYCDLLYRVVDQTTLASRLAQLTAGATRQQVAQQVLASAAYFGQLTENEYRRFLRRDPTPAEQSYWISQLQNGATDQQLTEVLTTSQEYFDRFSVGGGPTISVSSISSHGLIRLTLRRAATLSLRVMRVLPAAGDVAAAVPTASVGVGPVTRLVGTVSLGHHRPGRVTIRWHLKINGRRIKPGPYLVVLDARRGHKLVDVSDAIGVMLR